MAVATVAVLGPIVFAPTIAEGAWVQKESDNLLIRLDEGPGSFVSPSGRYISDDGVSAEISDGRAWWLSGDVQPQASSTIVSSRPLGGGPLRRTTLASRSLVPPTVGAPDGRPFVDVLTRQRRIANGDLVIVGEWRTAPTADPDIPRYTAPTGIEAVFDGTTGALLRQASPPLSPNGSPAHLLIDGTPATLRPTLDPAANAFSYSLEDPVDGRPLAGHGEQIAGRYILGYSIGRNAQWRNGQGALTVSDVQTGNIIYRVSAQRLRTAAGAPDSSRPSVWLQPDGSLRVKVTRSGADGLRPVVVSNRGAVRGLRRVRGAREVVTLTGHGRTFVSVAGRRPRNNARCAGIWITNTPGSRARELTMRGRSTGRNGAPTYWNGRTGVWSISTDVPSGRSPVAVRAEQGLAELKLSSRTLPGC